MSLYHLINLCLQLILALWKSWQHGRELLLVPFLCLLLASWHYLWDICHGSDVYGVVLLTQQLPRYVLLSLIVPPSCSLVWDYFSDSSFLTEVWRSAPQVVCGDWMRVMNWVKFNTDEAPPSSQVTQILVAWSQWCLPGSDLLISSFSFICFMGQKGWASVLVGAIAIHISSWRCLFPIYY